MTDRRRRGWGETYLPRRAGAQRRCHAGEVMQSVELLLDDALDAAVREEWRLLADAGLPSQARHTGPTNAPHVTLAVAAALSPAAEARLVNTVTDELPSLTLGGLLVFPGHVLARVVVPSAALLDLHARVIVAVGDEDGVVEHVHPGAWTPHVTLARRLGPDDLASAVRLLADAPRERTGRAAAVRRWDPRVRRAWTVSPDARA